MSRDPEHLHELIRPKLAKLLAECDRFGRPSQVTETWRDNREQMDAWLRGRNHAGEVVDPKAVVTDAKPGQSFHNLTYANGEPCSLAFHLALKHPNGGLRGFGRSLEAVDIEEYTFIGKIGEWLGLTWGGRWKLRDYTHFELRVAPLSVIVAALKAGRDVADLRSEVRAC